MDFFDTFFSKRCREQRFYDFHDSLRFTSWVVFFVVLWNVKFLQIFEILWFLWFLWKLWFFRFFWNFAIFANFCKFCNFCKFSHFYKKCIFLHFFRKLHIFDKNTYFCKNMHFLQKSDIFDIFVKNAFFSKITTFNRFLQKSHFWQKLQHRNFDASKFRKQWFSEICKFLKLRSKKYIFCNSRCRFRNLKIRIFTNLIFQFRTSLIDFLKHGVYSTL